MTEHILTDAEKEAKYDAERKGTLYVAPVATSQLDPIGELHAQIDASRDYATRLALVHQMGDLIGAKNAALKVEHENILIGSIDGCEVRAEYMPDDPDEGNGELAAAKITWQGITIATDGDSYLSLPMDGGFVGDMEIAQWSVIKRVAHTDIPERLIALAQRYPTYQSVLASPPASVNVVCVVRTVSNDCNSPDFGQEFGTDYVCGESLIHFPDDGKPPVLIAYDADRYDDTTERNVSDLIMLLSSPQVQAALARRATGPAQKRAA